jgi:hypothetical protein
MPAIIHTAPRHRTPEQQAELDKVISDMRTIADKAAVEAQKGRERHKKAVYRMRAERGDFPSINSRLPIPTPNFSYRVPARFR